MAHTYTTSLKKTIEDNPQTVKVYLNENAQGIFGRYQNKLKDTKGILHLISQQKYNGTIKEIFRAFARYSDIDDEMIKEMSDLL